MSATDAPGPRPVGFWVGAGAGLGLIVFGVVDLLHQSSATDPPGLTIWFAGAGVAHDAVIAPVAVAIGWATRKLPPPARVPVRLGLAATALLVVLVWPLVQGWGHNAALPSALPLDYGRNLTGALAGIWIVVGASVLVARRRA